MPDARQADRAAAGDHGRAGVRQRGAAVRVQFGHHGVRGNVALAVRLDDIPGGDLGAECLWAPGHRHAAGEAAAEGAAGAAGPGQPADAVRNLAAV